MIILALLHLHCYHPSSDQSFGPVLDDVASEGEPFESELGDLASFHTASLSYYLRNVVVVKCHLHSLANADPRVDNLARSWMELVVVQLLGVCDSPEDNNSLKLLLSNFPQQILLRRRIYEMKYNEKKYVTFEPRLRVPLE